MRLNLRNKRTWLAGVAKLAIVLMVVWFVRQTLVAGWEQLGQHPWHFDPLWLVLAGALYLVGLLPAAIFWHYILRRFGQDVRAAETLRAYFIGHLGKYVPGKAMVVVLRTGLIRSHRVVTGVAAVSVFVETLTMMAAGAFIAAAILAVWFHERSSPILFWTAVGLMVAAGLPTLPPVFKRLVRLLRVAPSGSESAEKLDRLGYRALLGGWAAMAVCWTLLGLSLWAVLCAMNLADWHTLVELPRFIASVSLATVAGFLSLVPGGAGVRELVLTELTTPYFRANATDIGPQAAALVSAVVLRLVWLVSELLISGMLYGWGRIAASNRSCR